MDARGVLNRKGLLLRYGGWTAETSDRMPGRCMDAGVYGIERGVQIDGWTVGVECVIPFFILVTFPSRFHIHLFFILPSTSPSFASSIPANYSTSLPFILSVLRYKNSSVLPSVPLSIPPCI